MFQHNISRQVKIDRAINAVAAGTGDTQNGDTIDTLGYESILFAVLFGTLTAGAVTTIKVQTGNASDGSDMADVANSSVSVPQATGGGQVFLSLELHRPTHRYARVTVTRATANDVINGGIVMLARGAEPPAQGVNAGNVTPTIAIGA